MSTPTATGPRLAVIPLANLSGDPRDEFFSDGLTEELISALSRVRGVRVIARTSAMRFKGRSVGIGEIAKALDVGAIVEGSVRRDGARVRVTAQLIDCASEEHLWSATYDRELSDLFAIQSDIARRIVKGLRVPLQRADAAALERSATRDIDAYTLYLEGRYQWNLRSPPSLLAAVELFHGALAKDPTFALAQSGLADSYCSLALLEFEAPSSAFPKARAAAEAALRVDPNLSEAHASLGLVRFQYERDFAGADKELRRAIELNPNYPAAHQFYADYLKAMGRFDEALREMRRALALDPVSLAINTGLGHVLYLSRQYDRAIEQYRAALALDPSFVQAHLWFGRPYLEKGMFDEAIAELRQAVELSHGSTISLAVLGHAFASAGRGPEAHEILRQLEERAKATYLPSYWIALIYTGLGETATALTWLERAADERSSWLVWIKVEPRFDRLRSDPRFELLLRRLGLAGAPTDDRPLLEFLYGLSELDLDRFSVVGSYTRHEERARHLLKDVRQRLVRPLESGARENALLWAPPGSGKTFLVREIARSAGPSVRYEEVNLAQTDEASLRNRLAEVATHDGPVFLLIDEADSHPTEAWPYETLLPQLDLAAKARGARVFVLAGSSGANLDEMASAMAARPKGSDLLSRIPTGSRWTVPPMTSEDRVLVAVATLPPTGADGAPMVREVEKLALYFLARTPALANPRQLRDFLARGLRRLPAGEDRLRFDHLFDPGDAESKEFWVRARAESPELIDRFVRVEAPEAPTHSGRSPL
ncbi:MAG: tetratricopeptide repeat protein [Thermoplasmata archaeon]|nr:tetratricopeptide repeat protein [Thermoplasmata archaeon]